MKILRKCVKYVKHNCFVIFCAGKYCYNLRTIGMDGQIEKRCSLYIEGDTLTSVKSERKGYLTTL